MVGYFPTEHNFSTISELDVQRSYALVTYHLRAIQNGLQSYPKPIHKVTAAILREVADVFEGIRPPPARASSLHPPPLQPNVLKTTNSDENSAIIHTAKSTASNACNVTIAKGHGSRKRDRTSAAKDSTSHQDLSPHSIKRQQLSIDYTLSQSLPDVTVICDPTGQTVVATTTQQDPNAIPLETPILDKEGHSASNASEPAGASHILVRSKVLRPPNITHNTTKNNACKAPTASSKATKQTKAHAVLSHVSSPSITNAEENDQSTTKSAKASALTPITYNLSNEVSAETISTCQELFFKQIQQMSIDVIVHGRWVVQTFTKGEAADITNLFFTDFLGWPAMNRLKDLIRGYRRIPETAVQLATIAKAEKAAHDTATPLLFRDLFASISCSAKLALETVIIEQRDKEITQFRNIYRTIKDVNLHNLYNTTLDVVEAMGKTAKTADNVKQAIVQAGIGLEHVAEKTDYITYLRNQGFKTRRGVDLKSCVRSYIAHRSGLTTSQLDLLCQQSEAVSHVIKLLGPGITVIFPIHASPKLRKWGLQRITKALDLFCEMMPQLKLISRLLQQHVYDPMMEGQPISLDIVRLVEVDTPLLNIIEDAVSRRKSENC